MARANTFMNGKEVFVAATVAGAGEGGMPATDARPMTIMQPMMFPKKLEVQTFAKPLRFAFFSRTAAGTSAVIPVKSGEPVMRTSIRPIGRPTEPKRRRCSPGLEAASSGTLPPTVKQSRALVPTKQPTHARWNRNSSVAELKCQVQAHNVIFKKSGANRRGWKE